MIFYQNAERIYNIEVPHIHKLDLESGLSQDKRPVIGTNTLVDINRFEINLEMLSHIRLSPFRKESSL